MREMLDATNCHIDLIYSILRPVDFVRGTAFAVRPSNYAGGEKAAKDYLQELEPGGANGILFAYEVNLAKKTCCGGFIYRTADDVSVAKTII